jgi:hypothetical protein
MSGERPRILYCHCAFAKVVAPEVKTAVLNGLAGADVEFDAVPDPCRWRLAATRDPGAATDEPLMIAACYPVP